MPTTTPATAPRKGRAAAKPMSQQDARAEIEQAMAKLGTIESELASLIERSLCETLHATGDVAQGIGHTVRELVGAAFAATRDVSQSLLQTGTQAAQTSRSNVIDAAATVQDFAHLATEAARQVMRGAAEGMAEIRSSHRARRHS